MLCTLRNTPIVTEITRSCLRRDLDKAKRASWSCIALGYVYRYPLGRNVYYNELA